MESMTPSARDAAASPGTLHLHLPPGVSLHRLDNGLEVLVREDRSAPVVSAQAWCRAGSIDEGPWLGAGLSHVLEHMLFKGTTTRGAGRIDQEVQAAGGYMNAYTSFDRTVYWINVPNTGAATAIDILCDIFQNATIPADELAKELDVIRREMDMGRDDPGRRASMGLFSAAYARSPYRFPIIGLMDHFNRVTRDDLMAYYREKYAPNNCFMVVVGDVRTDDVLRQVREAFKGTPGRPVPATVIPEEPRQTVARQVIDEAPVELAHFNVAWHMPGIRHPDTPALDVLSTLLGSGRSSRLYQAVRERAALVHSVSAWIYTPGLAGMFGVSGVCDGDKFAAARDEVLAEVERIKTERVSSAELAKAVKQFTAGTLATRKTMEGQAQDLGGNWMSAHDPGFSERYLAAVRRLDPEDIRRVANEYLVESNRTLHALVPTGRAPRPDVVVDETAEHPVHRWELANGLRLLVREDHRLPFVQFRMALGGGLLAETPTTSGLTGLMARLMSKGTARRTALQLADEIEGLGGSLEPYAGNHSFGVSAEVLSGDFAHGLDLVSDVLLRPSFPAEAVEREREAQLAGIKGQRDHLLSCAFKGLKRGLFGENGYGLDALGTEATVRSFRQEGIASFHRRMVVPHNAVLAIYGDIHAEAVRAEVEAAFAGWLPAPLPGAHPTARPTALTPRLVEERDKEQAVIALGFPGTTFDHPDRWPLELLQEACSDMGSRLFMRIRDELGLAYYVGASHFLGRTPGYFAFYCGTAPGEVDRVEAELRDQARQLAEGGLTDEELARAKAKVVGQRKIGRQDLGQVAMQAALDELYGLGHDHGDHEAERYEAVTAEQVRDAARRCLVADRAVVSVIRGRPARG